MSFPFIFLQLGTLACWWLVWFLYFPGFSVKKSDVHKKRAKNIFLKGMALFCFVSFFIGWALKAQRYYWPHGITSTDSFLLLGPEKEFPKRGLLKQGERIVIEQKKDGWYYVSSSLGKGWVQAVDVAVEGDA